jgi:hypothetical protein
MFYDDSEIQTSGINPTLLEEMHRDLADLKRNDAAPTEEELIEIEADLKITVRETPMDRDLTDPAHDALGQIRPEDAADFLQHIDDWFGTSDRWHVDTQGRVFVTVRLAGGEARVCGEHVARFLYGRGVRSRFAASIEMEPTREPGMYKPVLVTAGERKPMPYNVQCGTAESARAWAEDVEWFTRPTVCGGFGISTVAVEAAAEGKAA